MASVSPVVLIGLARLKRNTDWQRLENWNWREKLWFLSHGVSAEIQVTEPAAMVPVKLRLPPGWRRWRGFGGPLKDSLGGGNEGAAAGLGPRNLLSPGS